MQYSVHGPFEISSAEDLVKKSAAEQKSFWTNLKNELSEDIQYGCGCYLFALRTKQKMSKRESSKYTPYYAGQARKNCFKNECFQSHKLLIYLDVLRKHQGEPVLFLLTRRTAKGKLSKPSKAKTGYEDIDFLESSLIVAALKNNPNRLLKNSSQC
jgi:hypothetical protein